ncbi:MAG: hypothetical protein A3E25_06205 [Burkholderiales bacterium RIFCSPHIGHO2_12_FULL_69_20]|nr:MAG: hypothetical protein A3E25_06205 [Burkholderiales bacterium RIFCSPHIGHO2_12_FULL_69_20]
MQRRHLLRTTTGATALVLLAGCASLGEWSAEVSTFGDWPAGRAPGRYAFERLPSQQTQADAIQALEDAAAPALAAAGFQPVAAGAQPDVLVQLGARVSRADRSPWDDPLWWHGGFGYWHRSPWRGPVWGATWRTEPPRFDREVAVLIRDRASGKPLFEARASSESFQSSAAPVLQPLFAAALMDFPKPGINPRRVVVPTTP